MPQDFTQDVEIIKKWMAKEPHLPNDIGDLMLKKFLHSCYGSLEKTKRCIERFCVGRAMMPEVYTSRDPMSVRIQTAFSITSVVTYNLGEDELLLHQVDDPNLEKFNFYDLIKSFLIQADYWLQNHDCFPEGHIVVLDMKDFLLKIVTKVNIMYFKDFLIFLLEAMPVRVKQVHVVNTPSYYEKLYGLVKNVLPDEITNVIHFHLNAEGLQKALGKKGLPVDYGGDAESIKEQQRMWVKRIESSREMFLNDNLWKADIKKKPKDTTVENSMSGSFRTLSID